MKIQIIGWLYILVASIFFFSFLGNVLLLFTGGVIGFNQIWKGIGALLLGIYSFILGSAIKAYKKWAWYGGIITAGLALIGNLVSLLVFSFGGWMSLLISVIFNSFVIYGLFGEKQVFLKAGNLS